MGDARPDAGLDLDAVDIRRADGTRVSNGDVSRMVRDARDAVRGMAEQEDAPVDRPDGGGADGDAMGVDVDRYSRGRRHAGGW